MKLGVCYYPEHWPESQWKADASRMVEQGISVVRMGEFAWSRFEPQPGQYQWQWLHQVLDIMAERQLAVVLGTPTATPPKWLVQKHPDILAMDAAGQWRRFGSRRHYCFSSPSYRESSQTIVKAMVREFGTHPAVIAWQTDNEYGCHDTIRSYSPQACEGFRLWLQERYGDIATLNQAWGNVFWSMEYSDFTEIDLPLQTVTEANPSHVLDFYRFSSHQACTFNRLQVEIIKAGSPGRDVLHNYMGYITSFDHYKMGQDLDVATWDNYPLGFLVTYERDEDIRDRFFRTGHPDDSAFHHDLYRGVGGGRFGVMEQQPGPVNWASYNGVPLEGMVHLWTLEAFAHGAELLSYFRWRQAPFAQEQFHAALNLPDGSPADIAQEVSQAQVDIAGLMEFDLESSRAEVALVFDYESTWALDINPQGADYQSMDWVKTVYRSLRDLALDIDIISKNHDFSAYKVLVIPNLVHCDEALLEALKSFTGSIFLGPRCGSKTDHLGIPSQLPPGLLQDLIPLRVTKVESLPQRMPVAVQLGPCSSKILAWREWVESSIEPVYRSQDGLGIYYQRGQVSYLNACLDRLGMTRLLKDLCHKEGIETLTLPEGVRQRRRGELTFLFNYGPTIHTIPSQYPLVLGQHRLPPGAVAVWKSHKNPTS